MKNGMIKLVLFLVMLVPFQTSAQTLVGDVNGDGSVGIGDVTSMIHYLLTKDVALVLIQNADVNGNGSVEIDDLTILINYLLTNQWPMTVQTFTVNGVTFKMMPVEGGTFIMGSYLFPSFSYTHEVTLSDFYIGQTEVTQELWIAVMGTNPSHFTSRNGYSDNLQRPVECVSWFHCQDFIEKLNKLTGKTFRLPTEAEREFASMGGNKSHGYYFSGSQNAVDVAWFFPNLPSQVEGEEGFGTQPVGLKMPNELGLYDMSGNVYEWCWDYAQRYDVYAYPDEAQVNPTGPETGDSRVVRGGCYNSSETMLIWVKYRLMVYPSIEARDLGLRLVLVN